MGRIEIEHPINNVEQLAQEIPLLLKLAREKWQNYYSNPPAYLKELHKDNLQDLTDTVSKFNDEQIFEDVLKKCQTEFESNFKGPIRSDTLKDKIGQYYDYTCTDTKWAGLTPDEFLEDSAKSIRVLSSEEVQNLETFHQNMSRSYDSVEAQNKRNLQGSDKVENDTKSDSNIKPTPKLGFIAKNFATDLDGIKKNFSEAGTGECVLRGGGILAGLGVSYHFGRKAIRGTKIDPETREPVPMSWQQRTGSAIGALAGLAGVVVSATVKNPGRSA